MIQEQKQLLLIDLCARLPYGFIIYRLSDNANLKISNIGDFAHFLEYSEGEEFKLYLRPMSSMTDEEENKYNSLNAYEIGIFPQTEEAFDWLNAHHFDYRGLIEKGLAIEAPEDMYTKNDKNLDS